jgi:hypothetical protein
MKKTKNLIILLYFLLNGCGVDTGNPTLTNGKNPEGSISTVTIQISSYLCEKIKTCFDPILSECTTKIRSAANLTATLGLNATTYSNFDEIESGVANQNLQIDTIKRDACFHSISTISCSATNVQQAYNTSDIENLTQAWKLLTIDSNCNQFIY